MNNPVLNVGIITIEIAVTLREYISMEIPGIFFNHFCMNVSVFLIKILRNSSFSSHNEIKFPKQLRFLVILQSRR